MQVHTFIAESAADAVKQIRETLGTEAVVLNVRRSESQGFSRLWQKSRIEVLAHVPEKMSVAPAADTSNNLALAELREELRGLREKIQLPAQPVAHDFALVEGKTGDSLNPQFENVISGTNSLPRPATDGGWRVGALLENSGVMPLYAQRVVEELRRIHGEVPPEHLRHEIQMAAAVLSNCWRPSAPSDSGVHVFVGAPGAGKTTALCKWLAMASLVEGRSTAVWRLDGSVANTAESLSIFCEILGVPQERFVSRGSRKPDVDLLFIDLPGVNPNEATAMNDLARQLSLFPNAQVHLVLNGAYESGLLLEQARAFETLGADDVIVTHLDEETRWGKLWNLALGTNCSVRYLGAGQNIPGDFMSASPERIISQQFHRKPAFSQARNHVADALLNGE